MAGAEQGQPPGDSSTARREPLGPSETQLGANRAVVRRDGPMSGPQAQVLPSPFHPGNRAGRLPQSLPTP